MRRKFASSLGGGGHDAAAGCDLEGSLDEVKNMIIGKVKEYLR